MARGRVRSLRAVPVRRTRGDDPRGWIGFSVDDFEAAHDRAVAAGAEVVTEPTDEPWGRTAVYRDLDENLVALTQLAPRRLSGVRAAPAGAPRVVGADGYPGGWIAVALERGRFAGVERCGAFADVLALEAAVVAVDIPIGIPKIGRRPADAAARSFVGPRASSVFTTPPRAALEATTYADARARALELTGRSLSAQSYALRHKILEVDAHAHADDRVVEVHPEVSFCELAGRPLASKHTDAGLAGRRAPLAEAGIELPQRVRGIPEPDLLDAAIAAWTAARYACGEALPLPEGHSERIGAIWR